MKYSFGILKPDCVRRDLIGKAFELIENRNLKIIFSKKIRLSGDDARFLYSRCEGFNFFGKLIDFMTSGEVILFLTEALNCECAIRTLNSVTGQTDPSQAKPNTLRNMGLSVCENIAHSTADDETFKSEVEYFLSEEELSNLKLEP